MHLLFACPAALELSAADMLHYLQKAPCEMHLAPTQWRSGPMATAGQ